MLRSLLSWAVSHGQTARVRLLLANGVDPDFRYPDGRTPAERALVNGYPEIAELFPVAESPAPVDAYVGAALTANYQLMDALEAAAPGLVQRVRAERPGLVVWAAGGGRSGAVKALLARGYDVNALGRADTPIEQEWETALHAAVSNDDEELTRYLLEAGADPSIRDARFDATPLDWAHHLDRPRLVPLFEVK
jgi:ankyrin repeat protein